MARQGSRQARQQPQHQDKGKRRALSPVSSETTSEHRAANEWRGQPEYKNQRKRLKQETSRTPSTSPSSPRHPDEDLDVVREDGRPDDIGIPCFKLPTLAGLKGGGVGVTTGNVVEDSLHVLGTCQSTQSRLFQAAVDEILDNAFVSIVSGKHSAPGRYYIEHILGNLSGRNVSFARLEDVANIMLHGWRHRMAKYVGEAITNSDDLQETADSMVAALPFRLGDGGYSIKLVEDGSQTLVAPRNTRGQRDTNGPSSGQAHGAWLELDLPRHAQLHLDKTRHAPSPESVPHRARCLSIDGLDKVTSVTPASLVRGATLRPNTSCNKYGNEHLVKSFKDRFPESFDTFFSHVEQFRLRLSGQRRKSSQEDESFRKLAIFVYESLEKAQRNEWRQIHRQLRKGKVGGLDEAVGRELLRKHDVIAKLDLTSRPRWPQGESLEHQHPHDNDHRPREALSDNPTGSGSILLLDNPQNQGLGTGTSRNIVASSSRSVPGQYQSLGRPFRRLLGTIPTSITAGTLPQLIPFVVRKWCPTSQKVMFVIDTPDAPITDIQNHGLDRACTLAFGPALRYQSVEQWSGHIWVATFEDKASARRAKGKQIHIKDISITAEHLYRGPPTTFICDFSSIEAKEDEIALQIARTFSRSTVKPILRRQEAPKLYPASGRQYIVIIPKDLRLYRFYIPVQIEKSGKLFTACFKPLSLIAPCAICGAKHGKESCAHSSPVALPMLN